MKLVILSLVFSALLGGVAFAEESKTSTTESAVTKITSGDKKSRKKKVTMCSECGKPESECECEGHKDGHKEEKK